MTEGVKEKELGRGSEMLWLLGWVGRNGSITTVCMWLCVYVCVCVCVCIVLYVLH